MDSSAECGRARTRRRAAVDVALAVADVPAAVEVGATFTEALADNALAVATWAADLAR
ncbi:hypothetical protein [Brytella acorum]|uniref:Uncharacterized protein n=1 Tax=Brytella acorum TaxID=2959299 RepID=A0AA35UVX6_9PROT|nr:hypothetical protein [Brytella acorum]CAI9120473.1 hypothetical protein LMG32879_001306 [Brytella acorum]